MVSPANKVTSEMRIAGPSAIVGNGCLSLLDEVSVFDHLGRITLQAFQKWDFRNLGDCQKMMKVAYQHGTTEFLIL
jgi:hypothetical protein